jgi:hypothetical protein
MNHDNDLFPTFDELDADGAIREAAARVDPVTRAAFFKRAIAVTGAAAGASAVLGAMPSIAGAATPKGDVDILNYALTLEYLEAAFYKEANSKGALSGRLAKFAKTVAAHEEAHVGALKKALGSSAVKKPSFNFKGTTGNKDTFASTAKTLEDTGVKAYQGAAGNIKTPAILTAAISIHPVEARHAAWVASIMGDLPAPDAFNPAADMAAVLAAVKSTGFLGTAAGSSASGSAMSGTPQVTG